MKYSTDVGGEQASPLLLKMKDAASSEASYLRYEYSCENPEVHIIQLVA
jgi:hypothetical protein